MTKGGHKGDKQVKIMASRITACLIWLSGEPKVPGPGGWSFDCGLGLPASCRPKCKLVGTDGNVMALGGLVQRALKKAGRQDKVKEFADRLFQQGSYDEALVLMLEYVDAQ